MALNGLFCADVCFKKLLSHSHNNRFPIIHAAVYTYTHAWEIITDMWILSGLLFPCRLTFRLTSLSRPSLLRYLTFTSLHG